MTSCRRPILSLIAIVLLTTAVAAVAQDRQPALPIPSAPDPASRWQSQLLQVERLIRVGSHGRATTMLEELERAGAPRTRLLRSWISLAIALEDHAQVVTLCEEGLTTRPRSLRLLQQLAEAALALGRTEAARTALARSIEAAPNKVSAVARTMELWRDHGEPDEGLAICDSLRTAHDDPNLLRRPRAACLIAADRLDEAMGELAAELGANPMNLRLVRAELPPLLDDAAASGRAADALRDHVDLGAEVVLLRIDLLLRAGESGPAIDHLDPLLRDRRTAVATLRTASTLSREAPVIADVAARRATMTWLLAAFEGLAASPAVDRGQKVRVLDLLAGVAEDALLFGYLDEDAERSAARLERVLGMVRAGSPGSTRLYSAQILLARHTRDALGRPDEAADRLMRLLADLDLPLAGVALCRLELGVCHLAAGDTARARTVLTRLGRGTQFPEATGPAHYQLARLDLAQGHWESARDRLAAVALDDPRADHANDALDLALLIAEEAARPDGGPALIEAYAACMEAELRRDPDDRRKALDTFLATATEAGAAAESDLVSRARLELAALDAAEGRPDRAAERAAAVVADRPDGPRAASALLARGRWLVAAGDAAGARRAWERLVVQYPDDLAAEDARNLLKELP